MKKSSLKAILACVTVVILIAAGIVLAVRLLRKEQRRRTLAVGAALALGVALPQLALKAWYAPHIPEPAGEAMPAILYVAMGSNFENDGWFNNFNWGTYYS